MSRLERTALGLMGALCLLASLAAARGGADQAVVGRIDGILIEKSARTMTLLRAGKAVRVYKVALGSQAVGAKEREGDGRTPEGDYTIDSRNAGSHYHLALHIAYPNLADRERARKRGVNPGGAIMIHGLPNGLGWIGSAHRLRDWTQGCIAVTNAEIEEIWQLVPVGTRVEIRP